MTNLELMRAIHAHTVRHIADSRVWAVAPRSVNGVPCPWVFGVEACGVKVGGDYQPVMGRVMALLHAAAGQSFYHRFATEPDAVARDFARHLARLEEAEAPAFEQPEMAVA